MRWLFVILMAALAIVSLPAANAHGDKPHDAPVVTSELEASAIKKPTSSSTPQLTSSQGGEESFVSDTRTVLKNLHPATVHFPIALFLTAAILEFILIIRPAAPLRSTVRALVLGGAVGACIAALFGWIHTGLSFGGNEAMQVHRWLGSGIAIIGGLAAIVCTLEKERLGIFRFLIFGVAILVVIQGYFGAELAHGSNHLFGSH